MESQRPVSSVAPTLNCDMGESVGILSFGHDDELLTLVDTINVACGMHAGDPGAMAQIVAAAVAAGVTIGAHPGLPDIPGFGRREMALDAGEVRDLVRYQVGALVAFLDAAGAPLDHIKAHGALFGMLSRNAEMMHAFCDVAEQYGVPVFGLAGTSHETVATERGIGFVSEFYVDLDYNDDATIRVNRRGSSRDIAEVRQRTRQALTGSTTAISGEPIEVRAESFCIHSDLPNAPEVAREVRRIVAQRAT